MSEVKRITKTMADGLREICEEKNEQIADLRAQVEALTAQLEEANEDAERLASELEQWEVTYKTTVHNSRQLHRERMAK